jgi:hypothetical protein
MIPHCITSPRLNRHAYIFTFGFFSIYTDTNLPLSYWLFRSPYKTNLSLDATASINFTPHNRNTELLVCIHYSSFISFQKGLQSPVFPHNGKTQPLPTCLSRPRTAARLTSTETPNKTPLRDINRLLKTFPSILLPAYRTPSPNMGSHLPRPPDPRTSSLRQAPTRPSHVPLQLLHTPRRPTRLPRKQTRCFATLRADGLRPVVPGEARSQVLLQPSGRYAVPQHADGIIHDAHPARRRP